MSKTNMNVSRTTGTSFRSTSVTAVKKQVFNERGQLIQDYWVYTPVTTSRTGTRTCSTRIRTSSVTPGYTNYVGILPINGFYFLMEDTPISVADFHRYRPETTSTAKEDIHQFMNGDSVTSYHPLYTEVLTSQQIDSAKQAVAIKLRNKLKDMKINLAQAMAERKQVANMVGDTAISIASAIRNVRRGNLAGAARDLGVKVPKRANRRFKKSFSTDQSKAVANGWLALQYGWLPLLNDIYGAAETLANAPYDRLVGTVKAQKRIQQSFMDRKNTLPLGNDYSGMAIDYADATDTVDVRVGVTYTVSNSALTTLSKVGITNPALLVWELVPFSFVVDWFLPIGNWLSAMDATNGLTFHSGYETVFRRVESSAGREHAYTQISAKESTKQRSLRTYRKIEVTRKSLSGFPLAPFPSFKDPTSLTHMLNGLALLTNSIRGK